MDRSGTTASERHKPPRHTAPPSSSLSHRFKIIIRRLDLRGKTIADELKAIPGCPTTMVHMLEELEKLAVELCHALPKILSYW
jgi:hypothetical protein